jgi:hypothetical protein
MKNKAATTRISDRLTILGACLLALLSVPVSAQETSIGHRSTPGSSQETASAGTIPVSLIVSVEPKRGTEIPAVSREDVIVFQEKNRVRVADWVPLQGDQAGLQLFLLIDEGTTMTIGLQFDDLRHFIDEQPPTTAIGLGYMRNGTVQIAQDFTTDHAQVGKALRLPMGFVGAAASPYLSVTDLMKRWKPSIQRREIFMVSNGIDPLQPGLINSYLDEAIDVAQRDGIQIYTIYAASAGHFGHTLWRINIAQSNLSRLADESGGEAYFQGLETPIAFAPFLNQFADRLKHQYRLTFLAKTQKKAAYQRLRLQTEVTDAQLVAADRVYVPAAK